jgi:two-component system, NtrC family, sensor kinase
LLLERDPPAREALQLALEAAGFELRVCDGEPEGLAAALAGFVPQAVVVELNADTTSALSDMQARLPGTPVVVRSELTEPRHAVEALRRGAFGYLLREDNTAALVREIELAIADSEHRDHDRQRALRRAAHQQLEHTMATKTAELSALQHERARAEKLAALGTLLVGVVHELSAPLTVLRVDFASLEKMASLDPRVGLALKRARGAGERIERLCSTLRTLSRVGESRGWSELAGALEVSQTLCRAQVPPQVALTWAIDPSVTQVWLAHDDLVSVITNLVVNAAHALEAKSAGGAIAVKLVRTGPRAVLAVTDDGCGIEDENLSRVLDPFFTTRAAGKGTGLGLSLVDQIARSAGGGVTIESTWGAGTTVSVVLRAI